MARAARKALIKRRVEPYAQGDLDSMCGLYAIINAFRAVCREMTEEISARLFRHLVRSLTKHTKQVLSPVIVGTDTSLLRKLLDEAKHYLERILKIELIIESKGREFRSTSLGSAWERLSTIVDDTTVVILMLNGCCSHWTVLYDVKPRTIRLIDSSDRRELARSRCTLRPTKKRYHLKLSAAIAISRAA